MKPFDYLLLILWLLAIVVVITQVGKPKKPATPGVTAFIVAFDLALIAGLLWSRGVLS
jgi:hypothetical protein